MISIYDACLTRLIHSTVQRVCGLQARREWIEAMAARYPRLSSVTVQDDGEVWLSIDGDHLRVESMIAEFEQDGFVAFPSQVTWPERKITRLRGALGVVSLHERAPS